MPLFPPDVRPDRALITEVTKVLGVPGGPEEDISGNGESEDWDGWGLENFANESR